jgi:hypothetical protein
MDMAYLYGITKQLITGQIIRCMKVIGSKIKHMVSENLFILMAMCMKGSGRTIKLAVRGFTYIRTVVNTQVSGVRIYKKVLVLRNGIIFALNIRPDGSCYEGNFYEGIK